ncbi:nicotinamide-nucleotide amidohydrolase family protein [Nocardia sp. ET3-3]|uniref:Nicotinamide-nucleotide amidohydrolase family protein n=1 Tax=Nocardia terrae TaxID=2675851 RepID=A0A7K1V7J0_9NOCA|nr:CinA family protein [Nocardia terrae]MVU82614.1 nicotinamide-nucleotide amidohydrolase family protein [Nocardia terrae]
MADIDELAERVAGAARRAGLTVAVAESLTCGKLSSSLGAAPDSAHWLRGAVVAYSEQVKRQVLGVSDVPVVSEEAARAMAAGVRSLLDADVAVAVTGVGGPGPQDGEPAGSVWLAVDADGETRTRHEQFDCDPSAVLAAAIETALDMLLAAVQG